MPLLVYVGWTFYGQLAANSVVFIIPMCLLLLVAIL